MVGEEDDVLPRQRRQDVVALDVHVVQEEKYGSEKLDAEAGEDAAAHPAAEEGLGRVLLGQDTAQQAHARDRTDEIARDAAPWHRLSLP